MTPARSLDGRARAAGTSPETLRVQEPMDALRLYELSRRDAMIDNWRGCHSTSAQGPWYVAEHSDLAALLTRVAELTAQNDALRDALEEITRCGHESDCHALMDRECNCLQRDARTALAASSPTPNTPQEK